MSLAVLLDLGVRVTIRIALWRRNRPGASGGLRPAGTRTSALVSAGAALFVIVGAESFGPGGSDPGRGPGGLRDWLLGCGGVMLRDGANIRRLTTAATLWCSAAVGSLAGAGLEPMAIVGARRSWAPKSCYAPSAARATVASTTTHHPWTALTSSSRRPTTSWRSSPTARTIRACACSCRKR